MRRMAIGVILGCVLLVLIGCQQYYRVTSTTNGSEYVTESSDMSMNDDTGVLRFKDFKTGRFVVLQEYEMETIPLKRARAIVEAGKQNEQQ